MSANVELLGWKVSGLRCPDHEVNLCKPNSNIPFAVSLIQMPNGTGKTTTLNLLRATLSGSAENWSEKEILELRSGKDGNPKGLFIVNLKVDGHKLTFELTINFETPSVNYRTTFGSGVKTGFFPPRSISTFLTQQFVELFVFDGELAVNLTDSRKTRAREAIDALFQLSIFEGINKLLELNWQNHVSRAGHKGKKVLAHRKNRFSRLQERLASLKQEKTLLKKKLARQESELQKRTDAYNSAIAKDKNIGSKLEDVKSRLEKAQDELEKHAGSMILEMRYPSRLTAEFGRELKQLKIKLDKLKLPSTTSREFFIELSESNECICGRPMDDTIREAIIDRADKYLASDKVGILNAIKTDIDEHCGKNPDQHHKRHQSAITKLGTLLKSRDSIATEEKALIEQRLAQGDSELDTKKSEMEAARDDLSRIKLRLDELERPADETDDDETDCIKSLTKIVEDARQQLAEATSTVQLKNQTEILVAVIADALAKSRQALRMQIKDETNDRIKELLSLDPVLLGDIGDSLNLSGQQGASVGQTLSVAYAFLATMFSRSNYSLPFVVDSPAGPLDLKVRPQVAKLIPRLTKQFVAFTISSERQKFVDPLAEAALENVQYLTLFRETAATRKIKVPAGAIRTGNGVLVDGRQFFDRFDLDEE
jgi:DNA sulfur modification protein DndD